MSDEHNRPDEEREPEPGDAPADYPDPESGPASDPPPGQEAGEGKEHDL